MLLIPLLSVPFITFPSTMTNLLSVLSCNSDLDVCDSFRTPPYQGRVCPPFSKFLPSPWHIRQFCEGKPCCNKTQEGHTVYGVFRLHAGHWLAQRCCSNGQLVRQGKEGCCDG